MEQNFNDLLLELRGLDYSEVSIEELQKRISILMDGMEAHSLIINPNTYVYRISRCPKPVNISRLNYPPPEFATIGRVNEQNKAMFYASIGKNVPFYELEPENGELVTLSVWKTNKKLTLMHIGYYEGVTTKLNSARMLSPKILFAPDIRESIEEPTDLYKFLSEIFTEKVAKGQSDKYKLTIAISNIFLINEDFDGLVYPTMKMSGNSDNIALKPQVVDDHLELIAIEYLQLNRTSETSYSFKAFDSSVSWDIKGNIEWSGRSLGYVNLDKGLTYDSTFVGGDWVTSQEGHRLDPVPTDLINHDKTKLEEEFEIFPDTAFRITAPFLIPELNIQIRFSIILNPVDRTRSLSFYLPAAENAFTVCQSLISSYKNFIFLDIAAGFMGKSSDPFHPEPIAFSEFIEAKRIDIFSETEIEEAQIQHNFKSTGYLIIIH